MWAGLSCNILSSGSKGNATVITNGILVDCGVAFKLLRNVYRKLNIVLLSHIHQDHFRTPTIKKLAAERPLLRWATPPWLVTNVIECKVRPECIDIARPGSWLQYGEFKIQSFELMHNVPNCGYKIHFEDGRKVIYATDTNSMLGVKAKDYDLYLIEANYTQHGIEQRIRDKEAAGEHVYEYEVLKNHLSMEAANEWLYSNMGDDSRYIYMHSHEEDTIRHEIQV